MIKQLFAIMVVAASATATAQNVDIQRNEYGSGTPGQRGAENADNVTNDLFHSPQYLPYHPTAGTIWPRVVEVQCVRVGTSVSASYNRQGTATGVSATDKLKCEGYNWTPKMGRGEYLFFKPVIAEPVVAPVRERIILKEVPAKKMKE